MKGFMHGRVCTYMPFSRESWVELLTYFFTGNSGHEIVPVMLCETSITWTRCRMAYLMKCWNMVSVTWHLMLFISIMLCFSSCIMTSWYRNTFCFIISLWGKLLVTGEFLLQRIFDVFFTVSLCKQFNKHSSCWWCEITCRSFDITVMLLEKYFSTAFASGTKVLWINLIFRFLHVLISIMFI